MPVRLEYRASWWPLIFRAGPSRPLFCPAVQRGSAGGIAPPDAPAAMASVAISAPLNRSTRFTSVGAGPESVTSTVLYLPAAAGGYVNCSDADRAWTSAARRCFFELLPRVAAESRAALSSPIGAADPPNGTMRDRPHRMPWRRTRVARPDILPCVRCQPSHSQLRSKSAGAGCGGGAAIDAIPPKSAARNALKTIAPPAHGSAQKSDSSVHAVPSHSQVSPSPRSCAAPPNRLRVDCARCHTPWRDEFAQKALSRPVAPIRFHPIPRCRSGGRHRLRRTARCAVVRIESHRGTVSPCWHRISDLRPVLSIPLPRVTEESGGFVRRKARFGPSSASGKGHDMKTRRAPGADVLDLRFQLSAIPAPEVTERGVRERVPAEEHNASRRYVGVGHRMTNTGPGTHVLLLRPKHLRRIASSSGGGQAFWRAIDLSLNCLKQTHLRMECRRTRRVLDKRLLICFARKRRHALVSALGRLKRLAKLDGPQPHSNLSRRAWRNTSLPGSRRFAREKATEQSRISEQAAF